jgi:hypothetical protein
MAFQRGIVVITMLTAFTGMALPAQAQQPPAPIPVGECTAAGGHPEPDVNMLLGPRTVFCQGYQLVVGG